MDQSGRKFRMDSLEWIDGTSDGLNGPMEWMVGMVDPWTWMNEVG